MIEAHRKILDELFAELEEADIEYLQARNAMQEYIDYKKAGDIFEKSSQSLREYKKYNDIIKKLSSIEKEQGDKMRYEDRWRIHNETTNWTYQFFK